MDVPTAILPIGLTALQERCVRETCQTLSSPTTIEPFAKAESALRRIFSDTGNIVLVFNENLQDSERVFIFECLYEAGCQLPVLSMPSVSADGNIHAAFRDQLRYAIAQSRRQSVSEMNHGSCASTVATLREPLSAFAGCLVHDLRNLLSVLVPNVSLAISTARQPVPASDVLEELEEIAFIAKRLQNLVNQANLLTAAGLEDEEASSLSELTKLIEGEWAALLKEEGRELLLNVDTGSTCHTSIPSGLRMLAGQAVHFVLKQASEVGDAISLHLSSQAPSSEEGGDSVSGPIQIRCWVGKLWEPGQGQPMSVDPYLRNIGLYCAYWYTLQRGGEFAIYKIPGEVLGIEMKLPAVLGKGSADRAASSGCA